MERSGTGSSGSRGQAAPRRAQPRLRRRQRAAGWRLLPLLCLALALPTPAWALPPPRHNRTRWLNHSRELLAAANVSLHRLKEPDSLGFECTLEEIDLEDITKKQINTIRACIAQDPETGNCLGLERSTFDMSQCLQGIYEDLKAYRAELKNLSDQKLLAAIDEMMRALKPSSNVPQALVSAGQMSFKERMKLCSIFHAFQIRTVTIDRLMNHLSSPDSSL
ncbi:interleukin-12 subunit alpha [Indicator indicator]|uniref:interleukin-12 subunit alpha n=1 Tax=Indicator indicator TaxID=1002788 RepID=UPI0023DF9D09|nr:interleukin-12 subunit alpha [Indicator indicator]